MDQLSVRSSEKNQMRAWDLDNSAFPIGQEKDNGYSPQVFYRIVTNGTGQKEAWRELVVRPDVKYDTEFRHDSDGFSDSLSNIVSEKQDVIFKAPILFGYEWSQVCRSGCSLALWASRGWRLKRWDRRRVCRLSPFSLGYVKAICAAGMRPTPGKNSRKSVSSYLFTSLITFADPPLTSEEPTLGGFLSSILESSPIVLSTAADLCTWAPASLFTQDLVLSFVGLEPKSTTPIAWDQGDVGPGSRSTKTAQPNSVKICLPAFFDAPKLRKHAQPWARHPRRRLCRAIGSSSRKSTNWLFAPVLKDYLFPCSQSLRGCFQDSFLQCRSGLWKNLSYNLSSFSRSCLPPCSSTMLFPGILQSVPTTAKFCHKFIRSSCAMPVLPEMLSPLDYFDPAITSSIDWITRTTWLLSTSSSSEVLLSIPLDSYSEPPVPQPQLSPSSILYSNEVSGPGQSSSPICVQANIMPSPVWKMYLKLTCLRPSQTSLYWISS
ncbi:hypothetical protein NPIL_527471 [Nephila pilipes]|uniref:Uncharacterized protein n=1 Tax=Nephila pilipes TaxID=299642 RepID=A0A8X6MEX7_NEPPI|nr:hypothetical protein NPIL_527471 [Nephila pilipes]